MGSTKRVVGIWIARHGVDHYGNHRRLIHERQDIGVGIGQAARAGRDLRIVCVVFDRPMQSELERNTLIGAGTDMKLLVGILRGNRPGEFLLLARLSIVLAKKHVNNAAIVNGNARIATIPACDGEMKRGTRFPSETIERSG